jgi:hypothetical protein
MQSVQAPAWGLTARRRTAALAAGAVLVAGGAAAAIGLSGGGSSAAAHHAAPAAAGPAGVALLHGNALQAADCSDWNASTDAERAAAVGALKRDVGGATGYGPASTLDDAYAQNLFARACGQRIAQHWLLYELYIRAAGMQSYQPGT